MSTSKSLFVARDDLDWEPDAVRYGAETAWVRFAGWRINFFDADTDRFDFRSDLRFTYDEHREQPRRWLIDEFNQRFSLALLRQESEL